MLGAILGDIIGSSYEFVPMKDYDFEMWTDTSKFTDDTVLTVATADVLMNGGDYATTYQRYARKYPASGFGGMFARWVEEGHTEPYNSFGNGSAMRVSPIGFAFDDMDKVLEEAKCSAECTHNHPEGIKGAQATAAAILLARRGKDKPFIRTYLQDLFGYDLERKLDDIRPTYSFEVSCQRSVPESIIAFLESDDFEGAIRNAVSLGGDSDTMACITGGIAHAFYKEVPTGMVVKMAKHLDDDLRKVVADFVIAYPGKM